MIGTGHRITEPSSRGGAALSVQRARTFDVLGSTFEVSKHRIGYLAQRHKGRKENESFLTMASWRENVTQKGLVSLAWRKQVRSPMFEVGENSLKDFLCGLSALCAIFKISSKSTFNVRLWNFEPRTSNIVTT
jgi:hypothetical protein